MSQSKATDKTVYTTPSGMGGIFHVVIEEELGEERVRVRIHMPRNPDFHGNRFTTTRAKLKPE